MHYMCSMEELIPSLGTSVPSSSLLSVIVSQSDSPLQSVCKLYSDGPDSDLPDEDFDSPFDFCDEPILVSKSHLISITDDGKIWNWLFTAESSEDLEKEDATTGTVAETSKEELTTVGGKKKSTKKQGDTSFKVCLAC